MIVTSKNFPFLIFLVFLACGENETQTHERKTRQSAGATNGCDSSVDEMEGWFFSPNYPSDYEDDRMCRYQIRKYRSDVCRVELTFMDFDVDESPGCYSDYLDLQEGIPGGQRICGSVSAGTKKTLSFPPGRDLMTINFRSDASKARKGFMLKVNQLRNSCQRPIDHPRPPLPPPPPYRCDDIVTTLRGRITSPNYPHPYGPNQVCRYTIRRAEPSVCRVLLYLRFFSVRANGYGCPTDYLELPDGTRLCGLLSGRKTLAFPRTENELGLTFYSKSYGSDGGFDIYIQQVPCGRNVLPDSNSCDREIVEFEGRLTSPRFPAEYPNGQKCRFLIRKANPDVCLIELDFLTFELSNGICTGDFLQLPDGKQLCGLFRGSKLYRFVPGAASMTMAFVSDSYGTGKGFDIIIRQRRDSCNNYRPPRDSCDRTIISEMDVIESPGYPGNYPAGSLCVYTIRKSDPGICRAQLDFLTFDVGDNSDCLYDFLQIESTGERLCGRNVPTNRVLNFPAGSDAVRLTFHSRLSQISRRGFEIRIRQQRDSCYRPLETTTRVCTSVAEYSSAIQSERYPLPYPPDSECIYRIVRASSAVCRVELIFKRFEVGTSRDRICNDDYLEIPGRGRFCGRRDGEIVSVDFPRDQNDLMLRFRADSYDQHNGFMIEVKQLNSGCRDQPPSSQGCHETFAQESFDIMSPGFQNGSYRPNEDCRYQIRKYSFDICALEIRYNVFDLEESEDCSKDYLEIQDLKICGKLPLDSTRTYDFSEDTLAILFRSDGFNQRAGFFFSAQQKKC